MVNTQYIQRNYLRKPEQHLVQKEPQQEKPTDEEREDAISKFEPQRSIINLQSEFPKSENIPKYSLGVVIYVLIFICIIPYIMYKEQVRDEYLLAYVANVDMLATVLGYNGGPGFNIWRYLYNPNNASLFGFFSTTFINYTALVGATVLVALTTHQKNSWYYGWSGAFIFLLLTYLLPGNFIVLFQNRMEEYLENNFNIDESFGLIRYLIIVTVGLIFCVTIILVEALVIAATRPHIIKLLKQIHRKLGYY